MDAPEPTDDPEPTDEPDPTDELRRRAGPLAALPRPGLGRTRERFHALWELGTVDVTLARLGEAHADGHAILAEAGRCDLAGVDGDAALFGVWAAEPPDGRVSIERESNGWQLRGTKRWCSGASLIDKALVTAHRGEEILLACVEVRAGGVSPHPVGEWATPALVGTDTRSVDFDVHLDSTAVVGPTGWYLARAGFWWGGAGVAAIWAGGADGLLVRLLPVWRDDPISLAHLGAVHASVEAARAMIESVASAIDADPAMAAAAAARFTYCARHTADLTATTVIAHTTRALGPGPMTQDRHVSRRLADLALYIRQSHAERDLAALGASSSPVTTPGLGVRRAPEVEGGCRG